MPHASMKQLVLTALLSPFQALAMPPFILGKDKEEEEYYYHHEFSSLYA